MKTKDHLIWIDLEMTGLDPDRDLIIEIATVVTDKHLVVLDEGPVLAIHQNDAVLDSMDEWNTRQHKGSGLTERVKESGVDAERKLDAPGVYVDNQKIAALGLRVKKHRTYHGLALNVDMDLMPFKGINPCGIKGIVSTQLIDFKRDITLNEVKQGLSKYLLRYLDQTSSIISDVA